jgi:hypothetical protein
MSYYIDLKYLKLVSIRLDGFVQKNKDLWNCRCCYCGDSQKKKSKKRGFFYKKGNNLFYRCFNCEQSTTLYKVLEHLDSSLAKEYQTERFVEGGSKHGNYEKPKMIFKKPVFAKKSELNIPAISSLSEDHPAKAYILDRKIPKGCHKDLFYAEDFKSFVNKMYPEYNKELLDNDPRLIIPFRNENGDIFAFQGRTLGKSVLRYITVKIDDQLKLFGLDRLNKKEKMVVVEGPIDSLFIKNAVATADSNLMVAEYLGKDKLVLVYDNEPRNSNIVKQIGKAIDNGFNVCLFPDNFKGKDINEAVLSGLTKPEIQRIIDTNTFNGLRASVEFSKWKKC